MRRILRRPTVTHTVVVDRGNLGRADAVAPQDVDVGERKPGGERQRRSR